MNLFDADDSRFILEELISEVHSLRTESNEFQEEVTHLLRTLYSSYAYLSGSNLSRHIRNVERWLMDAERFYRRCTELRGELLELQVDDEGIKAWEDTLISINEFCESARAYATAVDMVRQVLQQEYESREWI